MKRLVIMSLVWLALASPAGGQEPLVLPQQLNEAAKARGCSQIEDFFRRPGMVEAPFVYGYLPGDPQKSAAFWCTKGMGRTKQYMLVFLFTESDHELTKCPHAIETDEYPGGLSIFSDKRVTLDRFVYLKERGRGGPKGVRLKHNAIKSSYDGLSSIFYCLRGDWLVWELD